MTKTSQIAALATAALLAAPGLAQDVAANLPMSAEAPASVPTEAPPAVAEEAATAVVEVPAATAADLPVESATSQDCELHLWPAERMQSITTGWLGGGLLDAVLHSGTDANNKTLIASALDSPSQLDALNELDLTALLSLSPGTTVVRHETPLERKTMNRVKTRRSDSSAQCYAELIVADVFYQKAAIYGRSLRTLFMFRDFGDDQKIDFEYKSWGGNGLKLFPPKEDEDAIAALDELVNVYKLNFDEYARKARTAMVRKAAP